MLWFFLALTSALAMSASDALSKRLSRDVSDLTNVLVRFLYAAPFMLLVLTAIDIPPLDRTFWLALAALLPLFAHRAWVRRAGPKDDDAPPPPASSTDVSPD